MADEPSENPENVGDSANASAEGVSEEKPESGGDGNEAVAASADSVFINEQNLEEAPKSGNGGIFNVLDGDEIRVAPTINPAEKGKNSTKDPSHLYDPTFYTPRALEDTEYEDAPTQNVMLTKMSEPPDAVCHKVTILGSCRVALSCILTLLAQKITSDIVVFDTEEGRAAGEIMDLQSAAVYLNNARIFATSEVEDTADSRVVIVSTSYSTLSSSLDLQDNVVSNAQVLRDIIPHILKHSPNAVVINAAFPNDLMTYVIFKLARAMNPEFETHRVIGLGNSVSTARLRFLVGCHLKMAPCSCRAMIVGEAGLESVPIWTSVTAGGVRIQDINPKAGYVDDPETWHDLGNSAANVESEVREIKNEPSCWGPGVILAQVTRAVLHNTMECFTLSTYIKGCRHGEDKDVFMSLPCVVGSYGVMQIAKQPLGEWERECLQASATFFYDAVTQFLSQ